MNNIFIQARSFGEVITHHTPSQKKFKYLIIGFHGYGERASVQMRRLQNINLPKQHTLLVCPQALHSFYIKKNTVGYSWMTSHNRGKSIHANTHYLKDLIATLQNEYTWEHLIFTGFSQGAAMVWRAGLVCKEASLLLPLGGDIPPEILQQPPKSFPKIYMGRCLDDEKIPLKFWQRDQGFLKASLFDFSIWEGAGHHHWNNEWSSSIKEKIYFACKTD